MSGPRAPTARERADTGEVEYPDFIPPELPLLVDEAPVGKDWVHEMKFDGYRIQAHLEKRGRHVVPHLISRSSQDWSATYPEIARALSALKVRSAILDGEVVALDETGQSNFQTLQLARQDPRGRKLQYFVFDLLELDGRDLRPLPLRERKAELRRLLKSARSDLLLYSEDIHIEGTKFLRASCDQGLEGMVSKKLSSAYVSGRTKDWVKVKCKKRQEFVIGGYTEPQGARSYFGALLLGVYENGRLRYVGKCGTGFNSETLQEVSRQLKRQEQAESPFDLKSPRGRGIHWVRPRLVAEVTFSQWTRDEILRVPVFMGLREDKAPEEILREEPRQMNVHLTHADKIIFRKEKITKGEIAEYYADAKVKRLMMPHLERRPLALMRCPDGKEGGCFFQKHMAKLPTGLKGTQSYLLLDSELGIQSLVQIGAFELHAWQCREPDVEHPDQIVIDFDPDPSVGFAQVKEAAAELKKLLDELGLRSFLKATGGKGLHVHIPIAPVYSWDRVKEFSRVLARELMSRHPGRYTDVLSKEARNGKIFVDYLRNGRGATAVVPYSLRARQKSAVALPIEWSELKKLKSADQFDLRTALRRIRRRRKDPWKDLVGLHQRIAILDETRSETRSETAAKEPRHASKKARPISSSPKKRKAVPTENPSRRKGAANPLRGRRPGAHRAGGGAAGVQERAP